jgi:hypothetical protein
MNKEKKLIKAGYKQLFNFVAIFQLHLINIILLRKNLRRFITKTSPDSSDGKLRDFISMFSSKEISILIKV